MTKITRIVIKTIPHDEQSYDTLGNWWITADGTLHVTTSEIGDHRMSMACGIHEAIEALLCNLDGVSGESVTQFDELYEKRRQAASDQRAVDHAEAGLSLRELFNCACRITADSEPGEDPHAPYRLQHAFADGIERLLAMELGVVWSEYADKIDALDYRGKVKHDAKTDEEGS